ncbi:MAG: 4-hydroxy-3-methylbut-2-enyl diphosphate reductase [Candidatus Tokpelaia sp. JSC188]|nr:MAG: 4-hydroxy-3-methylbut-2-enyl diphosphate reductase [Candidatus Tokpelaia sp. JSC188]
MSTKPPLTIRLCEPRGFCAGVDRAIQIVVATLKKYGAPVYVRHEIVHNRYVVEGLQAQGAIFVEDLEEIPNYHRDRPIIFSAHGVAKSVLEDAKRKNLFYLDATCPLVSKLHKQAICHYRKGRHVILIGHAGHPEVIGTMGQLPEGAVTLIETVRDAEQYQLQRVEQLGFVTQTTLSIEDTDSIIHILRKRFPLIKAPAVKSICYATTNRQNTVKTAAFGSDLFLIVGAPNSSNSRRLVEVAKKAGASLSLLVQGANEIIWEDLEPLYIVGLSAGASAPEIVISEIIEAFRKRYNLLVDLIHTVQEYESFPINRALRDVSLTCDDMAFVRGSHKGKQDF